MWVVSDILQEHGLQVMHKKGTRKAAASPFNAFLTEWQKQNTHSFVNKLQF